MSSFHLQIVTPDGLFYDGQAESLNLRAAQGGLTILPRHTNFVTTVGMGPAKVVLDGNARTAACIGGMLSVINGEVRLIATTFEWAEDIDRERAKSALERAEAKLADASLSKEEHRLAESAKRRAQVVPLTEEMENCIPDAVHERQMEAKELGRLLDLFLESLPKDSRLIFLRRYWYVDSVPEIAARYGMTESKVKMQLSRTKEKLRLFLEQEGIYV